MRHPPPLPPWLPAWMGSQGIALWGVAGLEGLGAPTDEEGRPFPRAIAWGVPMNPEIMARISRGPDRPYADEYVRVNRRLDEAGTPFCVTIDFDTLGEKPELLDTVTLRYRDDGRQERLKISELRDWLLARIR